MKFVFGFLCLLLVSCSSTDSNSTESESSTTETVESSTVATADQEALKQSLESSDTSSSVTSTDSSVSTSAASPTPSEDSVVDGEVLSISDIEVQCLIDRFRDQLNTSPTGQRGIYAASLDTGYEQRIVQGSFDCAALAEFITETVGDDDNLAACLLDRLEGNSLNTALDSNFSAEDQISIDIIEPCR